MQQHYAQKTKVHTLIYHFYSKIRYHLCFQRVIIFCWWGLVLWLHVGGCWRLGCLWQVLKIRWQWSLLPQLTSFHRWFLCSKMLFDSILPTELYRLESSLSNPARAVLLYQLSFCNVLNPLLFQQLSQYLHQEAAPSLETAASAWGWKASPHLLVFSGGGSSAVTSSGSTLVLVLLLFAPRLWWLPPRKEPLSHSWGVESASSKLLWPLMNHKCSWQHREWWIVSRRFSMHFAHLSLSVDNSLTKCIF